MAVGKSHHPCMDWFPMNLAFTALSCLPLGWTLEEAMFTWSLSPGDGGITGITVETPTLQQKKKPADGGGKKGEQIIIETEVKQE